MLCYAILFSSNENDFPILIFIIQSKKEITKNHSTRIEIALQDFCDNVFSDGMVFGVLCYPFLTLIF